MKKFILNSDELIFFIDCLLFELNYYIIEKEQNTDFEVIKYYDKQINRINEFLENFNEKHKTCI